MPPGRVGLIVAAGFARGETTPHRRTALSMQYLIRGDPAATCSGSVTSAMGPDLRLVVSLVGTLSRTPAATLTLPVAVILKRFLAPLFVFILGISLILSVKGEPVPRLRSQPTVERNLPFGSGTPFRFVKKQRKPPRHAPPGGSDALIVGQHANSKGTRLWGGTRG